MTIKFENHNAPPSASSENLITAFEKKILLKKIKYNII